MVSTDSTPTIVYEGPGVDAELLGATQANFFVPGLDREFAVLVNEPTLEYLSSELEGQNIQDWREDITRRLGELVIRRRLSRGIHDPITFVGRRVLDEDPSLLEELKQQAA